MNEIEWNQLTKLQESWDISYNRNNHTWKICRRWGFQWMNNKVNIASLKSFKLCHAGSGLAGTKEIENQGWKEKAWTYLTRKVEQTFTKQFETSFDLLVLQKGWNFVNEVKCKMYPVLFYYICGFGRETLKVIGRAFFSSVCLRIKYAKWIESEKENRQEELPESTIIW
jgi:hypothetical protein